MPDTELGILHSSLLSQAKLPHLYLVSTLILCSGTWFSHLDLVFCHSNFSFFFKVALTWLSFLLLVLQVILGRKPVPLSASMNLNFGLTSAGIPWVEANKTFFQEPLTLSPTTVGDVISMNLHTLKPGR